VVARQASYCPLGLRPPYSFNIKAVFCALCGMMWVDGGDFELEDTAVYRALQEHLDETPMGFPPAESGADIDS
jgi:hypothetical protein